MAEEERELQFFKETPSDETQAAAEFANVESLQKALASEKEKTDKYLSNWQRAQADFVNFKKRNELEKTETTKFSNGLLISGLLPVIDDFELALGNVTPKLAESKWVEGIELIYRKLLASLEGQGLSRIEAAGKDFDPKFHQAVFSEEGEEGKVIGELQKGYMLYDRLLRPAMVKVGKGKEKLSKEDSGEV